MINYDEQLHEILMDGTDLIIEGTWHDPHKKSNLFEEAIEAFNAKYPDGPQALYVYEPEYDYFLVVCSSEHNEEVQEDLRVNLENYLKTNNIEFI